MLWDENIGKWKGLQLPEVEARTPLTWATSNLSHQCSATEPWQLDNHQLSQSSIWTAQVSQLHTWQPLSMCHQNSIRDRLENCLHRMMLWGEKWKGQQSLGVEPRTPLVWAASALLLSHDSQTTTNPHTFLYFPVSGKLLWVLSWWTDFPVDP